MTDHFRSIVLFLQKLDARVDSGTPITLYVGGGAAVILGYNGPLATHDVDFIGTNDAVLNQLFELAGEGSDVHRQTEYYVDIVAPGMFPQQPGWRQRARPVEIPGLERIEIKVLELHNLMVSKLKRFLGKDREDVEWLCYHPDFKLDVLRSRYRDARQLYFYERDQLESLDRNFHFIEEEILSQEPTRFD